MLICNRFLILNELMDTFFSCLFIYLAASGLSCGTQVLQDLSFVAWVGS